jgi:TolA-binding protein
MATTEQKRSLKDLSPRELRNEYRKMKSERNELRERNNVLIEDNEELQATAAALREQVTEQQEEIERLNAANEELQTKYEQAVDNNTSLRALIDTAGAGRSSKALDDTRIVGRLDEIIGLLSTAMGINAPSEVSDDNSPLPILPLKTRNDTLDQPQDEMDDDGTEDEDDAGSPADAFDEDEDDEEDDEVIIVLAEGSDTPAVKTPELPVPAEAGSITTDPTSGVSHGAPPANNQAAAIQGASVNLDVPPAVPPAAKPMLGTTQVTQEQLTALVVPQIKDFIDMMGNDFETNMRVPIRNGDITKEHALRSLVATVFGQEEGTSMAEAILNADTTREAVYETMGV